MILRVRRNALCKICGRRIALTVYSGEFRRHVLSSGVVCDGSWKTPQDVDVRRQRERCLVPEWVYWLGWLAVPVAAVALSAWWHERNVSQALDELLQEIQGKYHETLVVNHQLRGEMRLLERKQTGERHALVQPRE